MRLSLKNKRITSILLSVGLALGLSSVAGVAQAAPATVTLTTHYHRELCDYDGWNLFVWKNLDTNGDVAVDQTPTSAFNFSEGASDSFGKTLVTTVTGMAEFKDLGFIVRLNQWAAKDVTADRFVSGWDANGAKEIWLVQGDPIIYTSKPDVPTCAAQMVGATIDSFDQITVTTNQPLPLTGSGNEGFTLNNGLTVTSVTPLNGTASSATKVRLNLSGDVVIGTRYEVTHTGATPEESFGTRVATIGGLMNSDAFNERYTYTGDDLGNTYTPEKTDFRVWAPTATAVTLQVWSAATGGTATETEMTQDVKGTWVASLNGDQHNTIYTYKVSVNNTVNSEVVDPYVRSATANGKRGVVLDLDATDPDGFYEAPRPAFSGKAVDASFYELHVRDLSMDSSSGISSAYRGKFLGLTQQNTSSTWNSTVVDPKTKKKKVVKNVVKTGISAIKDLGVSHVQLLPIYDYASVDELSPVFNWGYDPQNYNVPEGSYSTDPNNPMKRIRELKTAVKSMHSMGLRVIMDVVYNHVYDHTKFSMEKIVPGYWFRTDVAGNLLNGTGCGNETASERPMVRKFIVDSVKYWTNEYKLDGFRFDLMGIHDITTMQEVRAALTAIDPTILVIGEGWDMGGLPQNQRATQKNIANLAGIGVFNDQIRDGVKGSVFNGKEKGYVQGATIKYDDVKVGVTGNIYYSRSVQGNWTALEPGQSVNYVEAHDNYTLFDKLKMSTATNTSPAAIAAMARHASSIAILSQGMPFIHAGQEFLRSKDKDGNSYMSSDAVNSLKWRLRLTNQETYLYHKGLLALRKAHKAFRMSTATEVQNNLKFISNTSDVVAYYLNGKAVGDSWGTIVVAHNPLTKPVKLTLPTSLKGTWTIVVNGAKAGVSSLGTIKNTNVITVPAGGTFVIKK